MTVRWGILGAGWIVHTATASALRSAPSASLAGIAARDISRAQALEPDRSYSTYADLIDDDSIDAVYIALANDQHAAWIHRALESGKHVLCEKPLALSAEQTREAYGVAEAEGLLLVEAAWSMWHPRMRRIVDLVSSGEMGNLQSFLGTFTFDGVPEGNYRLDPELGGGALLDIGVYPLHTLTACAPGFEVQEIERDVNIGGLGVDMTTKARLIDETGTSASIVASFEMPESQRLTLETDAGQLRITDDQAFTSWREPTILEIDGRLEDFPATDAYQDMFEAVSGRILGRDDWVLDPASSIRVATLVDALR
jgi:predicted dehydrogenase